MSGAPRYAGKGRGSAIDLQIGRWIRDRRHNLGMSQQQMGDLLGVTYQQLHKYERGINRISVARLLRLTQLAGSSLSDFERYLTEDSLPIATAHPRSVNSLAHERFARLSAAQQAAVFVLAGVDEGDKHA